MKKQIPINTIADGFARWGGLARTLTARYYKTGASNILEHWTDGYATTGILEIEDTAGDEQGIH